MISLNQIKSSGFEPAHTSQGLVYFTSKNNGNKLNLLNKQYVPVVNYSFTISTIEKSLTLTPLQLEIQFPVGLQLIKEVQLEVIDDEEGTIRNIILDKWEQLFGKDTLLVKNIEQLLKDSWEMVIEIYKKDKTIKEKYFFNVIPSKDLTIRGDQDYSLGTLPISFSVLGVNKK